MLFFYLVALPVVACATLWALLFLPSRTTGKPSPSSANVPCPLPPHTHLAHAGCATAPHGHGERPSAHRMGPSCRLAAPAGRRPGLACRAGGAGAGAR